MYLCMVEVIARYSRFRDIIDSEPSANFSLSSLFLDYFFFNPCLCSCVYLDNSMARHYQAKQQRSRFETLLEGYSRLS